MSILVIGPDVGVDRAIVERLISEGDEVRVATDRVADAPVWKDIGAHVALGDINDPDLIERAAIGCRSVVVAGGNDDDSIVSGAHAADVGRVIVLVRTRRLADVVLERTEKIHEMDYVLITTRRGKIPWSSEIESQDVAAAVSAADDLAGHPRLIVDLATSEGRRSLGLAPA